MKAVILAGREGNAACALHDGLAEAADAGSEDMPILALLLRQLKDHGVTDVVLAIGYLGSADPGGHR